MAEFVRVARAGEIAPGEGTLVEAGGKKIALFNVDGKFHAIDDTCTHQGGTTLRRNGCGHRSDLPVARSRL